MSRRFGILIVCLGILLQACGGEEAQRPEFPSDTMELAPLPQDSFSFAEPDSAFWLSLVEKRKLEGDTMPLHGKLLLATFPDSFLNRRAEINEGQLFHTPGHAYGEATRVFYDSSGHYASYTLSDYASDPQMIGMLLHRYQNLDQFEGPQMEMRRLPLHTLPDSVPAFGWEERDNMRAVARRFGVLDYRYVLKVEATGQMATKRAGSLWRQFDRRGLNGQKPVPPPRPRPTVGGGVSPNPNPSPTPKPKPPVIVPPEGDGEDETPPPVVSPPPKEEDDSPPTPPPSNDGGDGGDDED